MEYSEAVSTLQHGRIYLYDIDETAMKICKAILIEKYGSCADNVHMISGDCLQENIHFPENCKVISNPPYGRQDSLTKYHYSCAKTTKELYVAFMEKILLEKVPGVIITPHSFLGGNTFKVLRKELSSCGSVG